MPSDQFLPTDLLQTAAKTLYTLHWGWVGGGGGGCTVRTCIPSIFFQLTCHRRQWEPYSVAHSSHTRVKPVRELRTTQKYGLHTLLQLRQDSWHLPNKQVVITNEIAFCYQIIGFGTGSNGECAWVFFYVFFFNVNSEEVSVTLSLIMLLAITPSTHVWVKRIATLQISI